MVPFLPAHICYREGTRFSLWKEQNEQEPTPPPTSRVTYSVEHNLSSLSCWLLPHSLNCSLGEEKRNSNPTSLSKSWGLMLLLTPLFMSSQPRGMSRASQRDQIPAHEDNIPVPLILSCSGGVGSWTETLEPSFLCIKIMMSPKVTPDIRRPWVTANSQNES